MTASRKRGGAAVTKIFTNGDMERSRHEGLQEGLRIAEKNLKTEQHKAQGRAILEQFVGTMETVKVPPGVVIAGGFMSTDNPIILNTVQFPISQLHAIAAAIKELLNGG